MNNNDLDIVGRVDWSVLVMELIKHEDVKALGKRVGVTYQCLNSIKSGNNNPSFVVGTRLLSIWTSFYLPLRPEVGNVKPRKIGLER